MGWDGVGQDQRGHRQKRGTHVMLFFVLYSIHFFFSLFFFSNCLKCNNRRGGAGQDIQDRGAGGQEDEVEGWAGSLKRGTGRGGERG